MLTSYLELFLTLIGVVAIFFFHYTLIKVDIATIKTRLDDLDKELSKLDIDTKSFTKSVNDKLDTIKSDLDVLVGNLQGKDVLR